MPRLLERFLKNSARSRLGMCPPRRAWSRGARRGFSISRVLLAPVLRTAIRRAREKSGRGRGELARVSWLAAAHGEGRGRQSLGVGVLRSVAVAGQLPHRCGSGVGMESVRSDEAVLWIDLRRARLASGEQGDRLRGRERVGRRRPRGPAGEAERPQMVRAVLHQRRNRRCRRDRRGAARRVAGGLSAGHGPPQSRRRRRGPPHCDRAGAIRCAAGWPGRRRAVAAGHAPRPRLSSRRRPRPGSVDSQSANQRMGGDHRVGSELHRGRGGREIGRSRGQRTGRLHRRLRRPHGHLDPGTARARSLRRHGPGRADAPGTLHGGERGLSAGRAGDLRQPHVLRRVQQGRHGAGRRVAHARPQVRGPGATARPGHSASQRRPLPGPGRLCHRQPHGRSRLSPPGQRRDV